MTVAVLSVGFRDVSVLADQNINKKGGILHNRGGLHNGDCAEAIGSFSGDYLGRGDKKLLKNDLLPLELERAQASNRNIGENSPFTSIRQKTLKAGDLMNYKAGANTIVENKFGPLDLVREDPMAMIRSPYHIDNGARGHNIWEMCYL